MKHTVRIYFTCKHPSGDCRHSSKEASVDDLLDEAKSLLSRKNVVSIAIGYMGHGPWRWSKETPSFSIT